MGSFVAGGGGVACFGDTLRPRHGEFVSWVARFKVASKKVMEAWIGLLDLSAVPQPDAFNFTDILSQQQYLLLQGLQDPNER